MVRAVIVTSSVFYYAHRIPLCAILLVFHQSKVLALRSSHSLSWPLLQRHGQPRVLGIPIPNTLTCVAGVERVGDREEGKEGGGLGREGKRHLL